MVGCGVYASEKFFETLNIDESFATVEVCFQFDTFNTPKSPPLKRANMRPTGHGLRRFRETHQFC
jgi:hypothetical protein